MELMATVELTPLRTDFKPTGIPQLDIVWGGGLPTGRIVEIHGQAGLGKSTLLVQAAVNRACAGDLVAYLDVDHALEGSLVDGVSNADAGPSSAQGVFEHRCPSTFNEIDALLDDYLARGFKLIVLDTIAMVIGDHDGRKVGSRFSKMNPAETSRLQAELLRIYRPQFARTGTTLLVGNQMRKEINQWKSHLKPCGGISLDHGLDVRTKLFPQKKVISECKSYHKLMVTTHKNRLGCPREELPLHLHFGSGVNRSEALAMLLRHFNAFTSQRGQYVSSHLPKALHGEQAFSDWVENNEAQAYAILSEKVGYELRGPSS